MRHITHQTIRSVDKGGLHDSEPFVLSEIVFSHCRFDNCLIGRNDADNLPRLKNLVFEDCYIFNCTFAPMILEDVTFHNLSNNDYVSLHMPLLRHVRLQGRISSLGISETAFLHDKQSPVVLEALQRYRESFYAATDWALDISAAKLSTFECSGIPAHLFIRDPDSQFVVKREKFHSLSLLEQDFQHHFPRLCDRLEDFLASGFDDMVIAVPLARPKKYRQLIWDGLRELRQMGLVEKD